MRLYLLLLSLLLLVGCRAPVGAAKEKTRTATVTVFEDRNENGEHDADEPILPDVLVAGYSNIHGAMTTTSRLTDGAGQASLTATYTHFFDVVVVEPCGYTATTETSQQVADEVLFGFAPRDPQSGSAEIHVLLWHDENGDGEYQTEEPPLADQTLTFNPGVPWGLRYTEVNGVLAVTTNAEGEATVNLGVSCGDVIIGIPDDVLPSTEGDSWQEDGYHATYQQGRTEIALGVFPLE